MNNENDNLTIQLKCGDIEFYVSGSKKDVDKEIKAFYKQFSSAKNAYKLINEGVCEFYMPNIYKNEEYTISIDVTSGSDSGMGY